MAIRQLSPETVNRIAAGEVVGVVYRGEKTTSDTNALRRSAPTLLNRVSASRPERIANSTSDILPIRYNGS